MSAGIYVHIPFCRSRCSYCDFATSPYQSTLAERYVSAVAKEILSFETTGTREVNTIYFGGGTPSLLSPAQLARILEAIHSCFGIKPETDLEITLEMNPGTVTLEILQEFRRLGVNRASFGAQTFDDRELARLGRSHTTAETRQTFRGLRDAGFTNVSFDLIAGLPGQTISEWNRNLDEALALRPEHLSFYLLEVHEGTPLADQIRRGMQPCTDDDLAAEMYELMLERACAAGYQHYEISNLCLPAFQAWHNSKYWTGEPYFGFGCSAHSFDGKFRRWSNERDVGRYIKLVEARESAIVESTQLSRDEARAEAIFLGMRMMRGVSLQEYQQLFGADLREGHGDDLDRFREAGLIEFDGDLVKLTRSGALLSNEVFSAFI
jgi:putative oxygen-independent coproporphyrinogen III oxidase